MQNTAFNHKNDKRMFKLHLISELKEALVSLKRNATKDCSNRNPHSSASIASTKNADF